MPIWLSCTKWIISPLAAPERSVDLASDEPGEIGAEIGGSHGVFKKVKNLAR